MGAGIAAYSGVATTFNGFIDRKLTMQTDIREGDEHLTDPIECHDCQWVGFTGDMMVSGKKPRPYCPKCGSMNIGAVKIVNV